MSAFCFMEEKRYYRKMTKIRLYAAIMERHCGEITESIRGVYRTLWNEGQLVLNRNLNLEDMLYVVNSIDETTAEISTTNQTKGYILRE